VRNVRRRVVVGAVLAAGFVVTGSARAEPARLVSEPLADRVSAAGEEPAATDPPAPVPSASDDLDPGWPPVLVAAVLAVVVAAAIVGVTFYRRARAAARGRR
jgi:hypothetical protein